MGETGEDVSRAERRRGARLLGRVVLVVVAVLSLAALAVIGYTAWRVRDVAAQKPPAQVVVIGESELEDGTTVAGLVAVLENDDGRVSVRAVDTASPAAIPGTSYDRLRDALAMGDADLVAELVREGEEDTEWLLLDEPSWSSLLVAGGEVEFEVPTSTTVFTGDRLFRFSPGSTTLDAASAAALARGSELLGKEGEQVRLDLGERLGSSALTQPERVLRLVADGDAQSSDERRVEAFLEAVEGR